ncbi:YcaO-like family protein [Clostridium sp. D2Q-14]|uniref:YcaO-like family protein n=1 Tax=Anaeromonas gelatinilytica TaxID=2683194 RepID=UPI00193C4AA4|nr:YcaO-like family protein [Anaeromonas gelatinilytica]MBS4535037.1 YcaO-like family protein [Anaeromonas gelatinilytica]
MKVYKYKDNNTNFFRSYNKIHLSCGKSFFNFSYDEHLYKLLKLIKFGFRFPEDFEKNELNVDNIKKYLYHLENVNIVNVFKTVAIIGKNEITSSLTTELSKNYYVSNLEDIEDLDRLKKYDLIIFVQNSNVSPLYIQINSLCFRLEIAVLNIIPNEDNLYVGPLIRPNKSACFDCFSKRKMINNLNFHIENAKIYYAENGKEYDNNIMTAYFDGSMTKSLIKLVNEYISIIFNKNFDSNKNSLKNYIYKVDKNGDYKKLYYYKTPNCNCIEGVDNYIENKITSREKTFEIEQTFINSEVGIFRKIHNVRERLNKDNLYYYTIEIPDIYSIMNKSKHYLERYSYAIAGGVSINENAALGKAIGEAMERYSLACYNKKDLIKDTINNLRGRGKKVINNLKLYSDNQFKRDNLRYKKIDENTDYYWTDVINYKDKSKYFAPASFIYSHYDRINDTNCIGRYSTSGAACGITEMDAIYSGILELIERDATTITWLNKLNPQKINLKGHCSDEINKLLSVLKDENIEVHLFDITLDIDIPVVLGVGIRKDNEKLPMALIGAGCRLNPLDATIRALEELVQGISLGCFCSDIESFSPGNEFENIVSFADRVRLFALKSSIHELDFLLNQIDEKNINEIKTLDTGNIEENIQICVDKLDAQNIEVFYKNITPSDIKTIGFEVVKVIIPKLNQIDANYSERFLGCDRIYNVPVKLGYKEKEERSLNKFPHPFP